jgi:hypothetical protein
MEAIDKDSLLRLFQIYGMGPLMRGLRLGTERSGAPGAVSREVTDRDSLLRPEEKLEIADSFERMGLPFSADLLRQWATRNDLPKTELFMPELSRRIQHEIQSVLWFYVPRERAKYYGGTEFGGDAVGAFPSARYDIDEAGKCFALGRYTACVLHLNRVLECGMDGLKRETGITSYSPTWKVALDQIAKAVSAKPEKEKTADERAKDRFILDAVHFLTTAKDAIRNPSTHKVEKIYTDETALEVYFAVRAFMRHLATRITE